MGTPSPKPEPKRYKLLALLFGGVIALYLAFHLLGLRITNTEELDARKPNFPAGGPAEFLYLDSGRVASYLAQVNGGSFDEERRSNRLTDALNGKLALAGVGEAGASRNSETFVERVMRPTDASSFFALHAGLDEEDLFEEVSLRRFGEDIANLPEGQFIRFRTRALLSPLYMNAYLAVRHASTLEAMFPHSVAQRKASREYFEDVGPHPRVVFALRPRDPANPKGERLPLAYLLPMRAAALTKERSLIKNGGGQFTVVGKLIRRFPEPRPEQFGYVDSPTLETWEQPLLRAPSELLCRADPRCITPIREEKLRGRLREAEVRRARRRAVEALRNQTVIEHRGAVVLPVAIYK